MRSLMHGRKNTPTARLIIASSEDDADMYYATRFFVPDPFVYVRIKNRSFAIMSDLEVDRAKKEALVSEVHSYSKWAFHAQKKLNRRPAFIDVVSFFLKSKKIWHISVPHRFPIGYADVLRRNGIRIGVGETPFFKERLFKTSPEINAIAETQRHTEAAMHAAMDAIARSRIQGGYLYKGSKRVTSEDIRLVMDQIFLDQSCVAEHTIVACGKQTCDPHQVGRGPLRAHEPIILDIFPRSKKTNYFADMTRTVVRGNASDALKRLYRTVKEGQDLGLSLVRDGAHGREIHNHITSYFETQGYKTGLKNGRMQGFFHGTGHGVGLEIHEPPRISASDDILREGMVVTVEPGLYYKDIGGVRLEDMVLVKKNGCRNITRFPRILEI